MTRTETPKSYSPRRLKLDKENVQSAARATPSPAKRSLRTSTGSAAGGSTPPMMVQLRTPPGSSKLLRQHFQQMSMAAAAASASSSGGKSQQQQQRRCHARLLDSGAVRVLSPRRSSASSRVESSPSSSLMNGSGSPSTKDGKKKNKNSTTTTTLHIHKVGILRSRSNDEESSATDQSFGSHNGIDWTLPSSNTPPKRRLDCVDPVAFTLLRGGEEDPVW
eukprot:CAMPEP_0117068892 /NCGR_PEP_ID=MMETSP0472-20121206/48289_1 /TAXON_ID=693140 ORGANISM="Tiarina fusus, Strain LIS" /NCGR_SAMPLE_ID=MMETSP0472 /ASSEMBLY_ACC=CAM_ASM_000603 /LENGTH=219 /DNA_ID=CAMNT_0004791149 /DNA_START=323 /DNA_END=979 /DNA_ORIENTATION=-